MVSRSCSCTSEEGFSIAEGWEVHLQTPLVARAVVGSLLKAGPGKVLPAINRTKISAC